MCVLQKGKNYIVKWSRWKTLSQLSNSPGYVSVGEFFKIDNDGFAQDCGNSSADALELAQSCTKLSTWLQR